MAERSKKIIFLLDILEILVLISLFTIIRSNRFNTEYLARYISLLTAATILAGVRLIFSCRQHSLHESENEKELSLISALQETNNILSREKAEIEKELRNYKLNHEKISKNVAELFTLQVVSETINSTLELDRLLNTVNDIIVGIMGVNTCTICIFEENQSGIRYLVSNEKRDDLLDKIRDRALFYLESKDSLGETVFVDEVDGFEPVTLISFTPVIKNKYLLGVIITGHTGDNIFDSENTRLMEIICNQISMAIENAKLYEKVNTMANTDFLTGLYNRSYFFNCFEKIISNTLEDGMFALAMLDIDNFKNINDEYGHDTGDLVLKGIAQVIRKMIRKDDIFARYGGEEFVLVMQNINAENGYERLDQIRESIQSTIFEHNEIRLSVTVSIGVVYFENSTDTQNTLVKKADMALYEAKKGGKNRIVVYNG